MRARAELGQKITGVSSHLEEVRRMIMAGLGIGPLPLRVAARDVRDQQLWQVFPYEGLPAIDVHVVWNPATVKNRAEELLLQEILTAIETTARVSCHVKRRSIAPVFIWTWVASMNSSSISYKRHRFPSQIIAQAVQPHI
ncbi:LysR substrate-binding domain-containing protein [Ruegeria profundi]|uniref:LysR substrate-binding domain-containing protein n=1 Tax=Ruegeria profundi TaxID=1685378 RepID=A0A0X3U0B9_9RHOB|nr:hypothetical protein AVO44_05460 [Ruegeria profundi]